ncbi:hypothetical protein Bpfe_025648, partial [Biomphalaria pfeifferi]
MASYRVKQQSSAAGSVAVVTPKSSDKRTVCTTEVIHIRAKTVANNKPSSSPQVIHSHETQTPKVKAPTFKSRGIAAAIFSSADSIACKGKVTSSKPNIASLFSSGEALAAKTKVTRSKSNLASLFSSGESLSKSSAPLLEKYLANTRPSSPSTNFSKRCTLKQLAGDVVVVATNGMVSTPPTSIKLGKSPANCSITDASLIEKTSRMTKSGSPSISSPRFRSASPKNSPKVAKATLHKTSSYA